MACTRAAIEKAATEAEAAAAVTMAAVDDLLDIVTTASRRPAGHCVGRSEQCASSNLSAARDKK